MSASGMINLIISNTVVSMSLSCNVTGSNTVFDLDSNWFPFIFLVKDAVSLKMRSIILRYRSCEEVTEQNLQEIVPVLEHKNKGDTD